MREKCLDSGMNCYVPWPNIPGAMHRAILEILEILAVSDCLSLLQLNSVNKNFTDVHHLV